jgi:hypothetical protein
MAQNICAQLKAKSVSALSTMEARRSSKLVQMTQESDCCYFVAFRLVLIAH